MEFDVYELFRGIFGEVHPSVRPWLDPLFLLLLAFLLGLLIRVLIIGRLQRIAARTNNFYDDIVLETLRSRLLLWVMLAALVLIVPTLPLEEVYIGLLESLVMAMFVISLTVAISRAFGSAVDRYGERSGASGVGGTTLIKYVGATLIYIGGIVVVLSLFDISVLPAITALGVGGLAVALAFQDTLANIFAGIHISLSKQIRIGDYLELSSGEAGFVQDIGWRATTMRMLSNNLIIVPNKKLAEAVMINYNLPEQRMSVELILPVSYDADPAIVEQIILEEVERAWGEVDGAVEEPPAVRFKSFDDSSLRIHVYAQVSKIEFKFSYAHEMMKRFWRRFREEGIEIPFPIRDVRLSGGQISVAQRDQANG